MKNVAFAISIVLNIILLAYSVRCASHVCPVVETKESAPVITEQVKPTETPEPVKETVAPTSTPAPQKPKETRPPAMATPVPEIGEGIYDDVGSVPDAGGSVPDDGGAIPDDGGSTPDDGGNSGSDNGGTSSPEAPAPEEPPVVGSGGENELPIA